MTNPKLKPEIFILVGGFGTRLRSVVSDRPKPMAEIEDKPFLALIVEWLVNQGFNRINFLTYHEAQMISEYFQDGSLFNAKISYIQEAKPLGTGGAILNALFESKQQGPFLLLNGDSFFNLNLNEFVDKNEEENFAMALSYQVDCSRYGTVSYDQNENLLEFREKDLTAKESYINAGIYYFSSPEIFKEIPRNEKLSLENDIIPNFISNNIKIKVHLADDYFIDIGLPESYQAFIDYYKNNIRT